jgi:hypothetical protein
VTIGPRLSTPDQESRLPKLWQVAAMAVIAVGFTALFVTIHDALTSAIWTNTLPS